MRMLQATSSTGAIGGARASSRCPRGVRPDAVPRPCAPLAGNNERRTPLLRPSAYSSTNGRDGFGATPENPFSSTRAMTPEEAMKRVEELPKLLQEIITILLQVGPQGAFRGVQAAQAVTTVMLEVLATSQDGTPPKPEVVLRKLFEQLGATYIKLGQFIASSPTLFPEEYVTEFQKCLDATDPVPYSVIERTIKSELKQPIDQVFESIDPKPLASASVAQVHTAVLKSSGQAVVIKVLKPGVEDVLSTDLSFIYIAAKLLEFISPSLERTSLSAIVGDVKTSMLEEVDFMKEAQHINEFSMYLDKTGSRQFATCPFVYKDLTSKRVLVMERLYGVPLTDLEAIRSVTQGKMRTPEEILIAALNTWFGSVVGAETFHADVHAGNLLVLSDGRVGFIDFGIVGRIKPVTWKAVEALMVATASADYDMMARALLTMGATDEEVDIPKFSRDLEQIFRQIESIDSDLVVGGNPADGFQAQVVVDDTQVNRLLIDIIRVGEDNGIRFPREFGILMKQLLYFDRYTQILAPGLQVYQDSRIDIANDVRQSGF